MKKFGSSPKTTDWCGKATVVLDVITRMSNSINQKETFSKGRVCNIADSSINFIEKETVKEKGIHPPSEDTLCNAAVLGDGQIVATTAELFGDDFDTTSASNCTVVWLA